MDRKRKTRPRVRHFTFHEINISECKAYFIRRKFTLAKELAEDFPYRTTRPNIFACKVCFTKFETSLVELVMKMLQEKKT